MAILTCILWAGCSSRQRLEQSQLQDHAGFGSAVALAGVIAVVGTPEENDGRGAVYVYRLEDGIWSLEARLESPNPEEGERFGAAVATNQSILVVGAPGARETPSGERVGLVHAFRRSDGEWAHSQTLSSDLETGGQAFGSAIALSDLLVVGAPGSAGDEPIGAAYAYRFGSRTGPFISAPVELYPPVQTPNDRFGASVAMTEATIFVGAPLANDGDGAVVSFDRDDYDPVEVVTAAGEGQRFGSSLDVFETQLVVGAPADGGGGEPQVYLYQELPLVSLFPFPAIHHVIVAVGRILDETGDRHGRFGADVEVFDQRLLVAAPGANRVYAFERDGGWNPTTALTSPIALDGGRFGTALALSDSVALVGAPGEDAGTQNPGSGTVHFFRGESWGHAQWLAPSLIDSAWYAIAALAEELLVVASRERADVYQATSSAFSLRHTIPARDEHQIGNIATDGHSIAIFHQTEYGEQSSLEVLVPSEEGVWTLQQVLEPDLDEERLFDGSNSVSLALEGDTMVLGAPRWDAGDGQVILYTRRDGVWTLLQEPLFSSQAATNFDRNYGQDVRLHGDWLAIAEVPSSGEDGTLKHGIVHILEREDGVFVERQVLHEAISTETDRYGHSLAMYEDLLAVYGYRNRRLHVYRRVDGVYGEIWSGTTGDDARASRLAMNERYVAAAVSSASYDGLTNAGEVLLFERRSDDSYDLVRTLRPEDPVSGLWFGSWIVASGSRLAAGTSSQGVYVYGAAL